MCAGTPESAVRQHIDGEFNSTATFIRNSTRVPAGQVRYNLMLTRLMVFLQRALRIESLGIGDKSFAINTSSLLVFGIFLFVMDRSLGFMVPAWIALSLSGGALIALVLVRLRMTYAAKMLVHTHTSLAICAINTVFSLSSLIILFLVPVFVSLVVVFSGRERWFSFIFGSLLLVACTWLVLADPRFQPIELGTDDMDIIRIVNVLGAILFTLFQTAFTVQVNERYRADLMELNRESAVYNASLETNVTERNRLIQMMSHDLRSPFSNLIIGLDDAVMAELDEQERLALIQRIRSEASSTLGMLDGILLWVRSRQGSLKLDIHRTPVTPLVEQLCSQFAEEASRKHIELRTEVQEHLHVQADRFAISSVLRNLVSNSLKFTPPNGHVLVTATMDQGQARFVVRDTGHGMTPDELEHVRQRLSFSRRGTNNEKGHGVGLLIAQEFLDRHDSRLEVNSTPGGRTEFSFRIAAG
jgi:signal transduction histidine kinase